MAKEIVLDLVIRHGFQVSPLMAGIGAARAASR